MSFKKPGLKKQMVGVALGLHVQTRCPNSALQTAGLVLPLSTGSTDNDVVNVL